MKCYYHPNADAVGTCKNCGRGLCPNCITGFDDGLACAERCEEKVLALNAAISKNQALIARSPAAYLRVIFVYGLMGIALAGYGFSEIGETPELGTFLMMMGGVFLVAALVYYRSYVRARDLVK